MDPFLITLIVAIFVIYTIGLRKLYKATALAEARLRISKTVTESLKANQPEITVLQLLNQIQHTDDYKLNMKLGALLADIVNAQDHSGKISTIRLRQIANQ